ncbi:NACHT domain-containing protein [Paenarthrobacter sp. OM7]|uniref:NACHT domain-containing protein n=1 Tax=Paenarthrobacter sp. OM7 TaxID=3041264 RepID=UPI0024690D49|nr:NACHT domain-containing protein [Paenarthrobacter sp. OM7]WGM19861.1 NACHT domain-containing protein [Paenarthrobacter sp. OM7]
MTGIVEAVAVKAIEAAITAAGKKTGQRLWAGINPFAKRNKKKAETLSRLMRSLDFTDRVSLIGVLDDLPDGITLQSVERVLTSLPMKSIVQELISANLVSVSPERLSTVHENFHLVMSQQLPSAEKAGVSRLSDAVLERIEIAINRVLDEFKQVDAGGFDQLQTVAATGLVDATLRATDRHNSLLNHYQSAENIKRLSTWIQDYRHQAGSAHGYITPPDLERKRKISMDSLYVPPSIHPLNPAQDYGELAMEEFSGTIDRTVLLGDPGGGKSTAASHIAYTYSKDEEARLPFIVVLRDYAKDNDIEKSIATYIEERCSTFYQCKPPEGAIEHLLLNGEALIIFDGLDELIDTSKRREVTQRVELFSERYPLSAALVTSRRVGYELAQLDPRVFSTFVLGGFDAENVKLYVQKWFSSVEELEGEELDSACVNFVEESSGVPDLTSTPLMLALMCIIYLGQGYIPKNRPAVYESCALLLFQRWDKDRKIFVELRAANEVDSAIKHLAYWMLTDQAGAEAVTESELVTETTEFLNSAFEDPRERKLAAEEFVEFCRNRAWVLTAAGTTEDGEGLFKFTHRTFMEYFAAFELTRITDGPSEVAKVLLPHIAKQEWDVVGQLAVQISNKHSKNGAARIFEAFLSDKRKRSDVSRDSINGFMWRCLSFMPVGSKLVRRLVDASLESSYNSQLADRSKVGSHTASIFRVVGVLPDVRSIVADALMEGILRQAVEGDEGRKAFSRLFLASWQIVSDRVGAHGTPSAEWWMNWYEDRFLEHRALLLQEGPWEKDIWRIALLHGHIEMDEFLEKSKTWPGRLFDPLFESQSTPFYGSSYLDWTSAVLGSERWTKDPENKPWRLEQLRQLGKSVVPVADTPWLDASSVKDAWVHMWVWGLGTEQFVDDEDVNWALWALLCAMLEIKQHLKAGGHGASERRDDFTDELMHYRSSAVSPPSDFFEGGMFSRFAGDRQAFRDAWARGSVSVLETSSREG